MSVRRHGRLAEPRGSRGCQHKVDQDILYKEVEGKEAVV